MSLLTRARASDLTLEGPKLYIRVYRSSICGQSAQYL